MSPYTTRFTPAFSSSKGADALGSSPHDEYPKETQIGEDKTLGLNTVRELWLPSMSLRWSNSLRVHSSQISWRKITGETLPTWIGIKVAVSLYHQCCARILPCQVVEESRILLHNAGWGQRHSQLRSGCSIALTGTPIRRHPWNVTTSKCATHKYTAPTVSQRSSFKSARHDDRGEDEDQWELNRGSMHCMHCRVREGERSGFGKTAVGPPRLRLFLGCYGPFLDCNMLTPLPVSMVLQNFTNCLIR